MWPPWREIIEKHVESPRPLPFCFVVKNGSKMRGNISWGIPTPESRNDISTFSQEGEDWSVLVKSDIRCRHRDPSAPWAWPACRMTMLSMTCPSGPCRNRRATGREAHRSGRDARAAEGELHRVWIDRKKGPPSLRGSALGEGEELLREPPRPVDGGQGLGQVALDSLVRGFSLAPAVQRRTDS